MRKSRAERKAANPINPEGVPRGPAKTAVYSEVARLKTEGADPFERADLRTRSVPRERRANPWVKVLAGGDKVGRLLGRDIAYLLVRRAEFLEYVMTTNSEPLHEDRKQEHDETLIALSHIALSEEQAALDDLRHIHALAMRQTGKTELGHPAPGETYPVARSKATKAFEAEHNRRLYIVSDRLERTAERVMKARRKEERLAAQGSSKARGFRDQLGVLPDLTPNEQAQRVNEWVREMRRLGFLPPRS